MAREFPIHNGRMTTDLDANGHKIKNLPPGSGFTQVQSDWGQTDTTAPDFIKNKPPIPAPVTIDPSLSPTSENPVQNKAVAKALADKLDGAAAYPAWEDDKEYAPNAIVSHNGRLWKNREPDNNQEPSAAAGWIEVFIGLMKQDALSQSQLAAVNSGATAAKVTEWDGYAAQIAQKASITDLPYAMYTPQLDAYTSWDVEWTGSSERATMEWVGNGWQLNGSEDGTFLGGDETSTHFEGEAPSFGFDTYSATRSLAYGLHDRANNLIDAQTGNVTLTLPQFEEGKVRDLLVACTIGLDTNDEPWSVIFQGADGEEISFKAEGDDAASATFPVPDAAGDWWYSLTERAPHVFAVSLKQLQSVSQPVAQGGS